MNEWETDISQCPFNIKDCNWKICTLDCASNYKDNYIYCSIKNEKSAINTKDIL